MHRLHGWTDEDTAAAEKLLIDAVVHALAVVCNQMADQLGAITVAAGGEELSPLQDLAAKVKAAMEAAPAGPPGQPYVSVDDLAAMPGLWTGQMQQFILPLEAEIYRDAAGKLHADLVDLVGPQVPSIGSQAAEEFLAAAANRWDFIGDDVWSTARAQLVEGFAQGESIPKLAARVRSAAPLSVRNATAVARTEVVAASNAGSYATAQSSQLDMVKVWLATEDERTRPTHNAADGQKQPLAQPFEVGLSSLAFPGDPGGAPQEVKNCRCTVTYEIPDAAVKAAKKAAKPKPVKKAVPAPPPVLDEAALRQADIDKVRPDADALAKIDEAFGIAANSGPLTNDTLELVIEAINDATVDVPGISTDVRMAWAEVGDVMGINDLLEFRNDIKFLESNRSLRRVDDAFAGDTIKYDPDRHDLTDPTIATPLGAEVRVVRPGYTYRRNGEDIPLSRPLVEVVIRRDIEDQVKAGDFSGLVQIGPARGSNPAGLFEAGRGLRYYVKTAKTDEHARNEALANALYRAAGVDVPELTLGTGAPGINAGRQIASRIVDDTSPFGLGASPTDLATAQRGFAVDALLANWDVVGASFDNMLITQAGGVFRIDTGGSLLFRAQGGAKGDKFGTAVLEWDSMRTTGTAGQIFGSMTREQLLESLELVRKLTPAKIRKIVKDHGFGGELADLLIARRADLLARGKLLGKRRVGDARYRARVTRARKEDDALVMPRVKLSEVPAGPVKDALVDYMGNGYRRLNKQLRAANGDASQLDIQQQTLQRSIDQAMADSRLAADAVVLRGFPNGRQIYGAGWSDTDMTGLEWTDHAYSSSTVDSHIANSFAETSYRHTDSVILHVLVPRGTSAVQISGRGYESELLLQRGLKYRVVADNGYRDGARRLDVEVIP